MFKQLLSDLKLNSVVDIRHNLSATLVIPSHLSSGAT